MYSEEDRRGQISAALDAYQESEGVRDTLRIDLRGPEVLPVVEVPLDLPVLNVDSFRIAPQLADHPQFDQIHANPESDAAQTVVAQLVKAAHRHADELKLSLAEDSQAQAGVITRGGKLINANTRCVLLRELRDEGASSVKTLRVAVLPGDFTEQQELELESVLQKQREHKDEYTLVGELMMLRKLSEVAGMTDGEINRLLRVKGGEKRVSDLRAVLDLMERARNLTTIPMTLSDFVSKEDKQENWLDLLKKVRNIDATEGRNAGDDHVRRWLIAYTVGLDSVHTLRSATGSWVEEDVLPELAVGNDLAATIAESVKLEAKSDPDFTVGAATSSALDLLGREPEPPTSTDSAVVRKTLDLVVAAKRAQSGSGTVQVGGQKLPAVDVTESITTSVRSGLDRVKRRNAAGSRIQRPTAALDRAVSALRDSIDSIEDVSDEAEFQRTVPALRELLNEAITLVQAIDETLVAEPGPND
jgi:hypothetical protein